MTILKNLRTVDSIMGVFTKTIAELSNHEEYMAQKAMKYEDVIIRAAEEKATCLSEIEKAKSIKTKLSQIIN